MKRFIPVAILIAGVALLLYPACVHADLLPLDPVPANPLPYHGLTLTDRFVRFIPYLMLTLVIEIPVYLIAGMRDKRSILAVVVANLVSFSLFYTATVIISHYRSFFIQEMSDYFIAIPEAGVILLETIILKLFLKDKSFFKLLLIVTAANIASVVAGVVILYLIYSLGLF